MGEKREITFSLRELLTWVVLAIILSVGAGFLGAGITGIVEVATPSPPQSRPILFTDWVVDDHGQAIWVSDGYLRLIPDNLWGSFDLREEVLEKSADYQWLEMEVYAPPQSGWKMVVFVYYDDSRNESFYLAPQAELLKDSWSSSLFDGEYQILVSPGGWEKIRLPLGTAEYGRLMSLNLTVYWSEVLIRNITLVP